MRICPFRVRGEWPLRTGTGPVGILLCGDPEARWAAHKIALETGVLDADEVLDIEGRNPRTTSHAEAVNMQDVATGWDGVDPVPDRLKLAALARIATAFDNRTNVSPCDAGALHRDARPDP